MDELLNEQSIDGIDQWASLLGSTESPRTEMIYNIDPGSKNSKEFFIHAGIRVNEMKLLLGNPGQPDRAIPVEEVIEGILNWHHDFALNISSCIKLFSIQFLNFLKNVVAVGCSSYIYFPPWIWKNILKTLFSIEFTFWYFCFVSNLRTLVE